MRALKKHVLVVLVLSVSVFYLIGLSVSSRRAMTFTFHYLNKTVGHYRHVPSAAAAIAVKSCLDDPMTNLSAVMLNRANYSTSAWRRTTRRCSHLMTIQEFNGRTGNHLFKVASLLGTSHLHGYLPVVPASCPLVQLFDLPFIVDVHLSNSKDFKLYHCARYNQSIRRLDHKVNWTLKGYYQSWRYFSDVEAIVRAAFKIKKQYLDEAKGFLSNVSIVGVQNVGVHIRRGDMLIGDHFGYNIAGLDFIKRAVDYYRTMIGSVQYIIVSDGMEWCKEHVTGPDILYSPFFKPITDLALLSLCDHVIVTSGTFGWWGAWLANGTTVYFKGYPRKGSQLYSQTNLTDYYPRSWIGL